jgi:hypothetical protein
MNVELLVMDFKQFEKFKIETMEIKTKFKVGDLVKHKYDKDDTHTFYLNEIMNVITETCYSGTQVFYLCRGIYKSRRYRNDYDRSESNENYEYAIFHQVRGESSNSLNSGYQKYREDELRLLTKSENLFFKE